MGVVGLFVVMLGNLFIRSDALSMVISVVGVLLFAGLTAYDTQKIKSTYAYVAGTDMMGKTAIMGALNLYLDFINMFQFLLSLHGQPRIGFRNSTKIEGPAGNCRPFFYGLDRQLDASSSR